LRDRFGVKGLPTVVFLDASGKERTDLRAGEELTLGSMERKVAAARSGQKLAADEGSASDWSSRLQGAPIWLQLGLVFLGGLLLNLTPCVYPMIPITVGYFGAQSEGRTGKTFGLALLYVLGLALVYSTLGVFAARTGNLFGATMQSPWVLGFVALVLGGLGLSMAGLFTINPPRWALSRAGGKKGAWGALAMGALLGVVAAPCVGPVVAALLTYVGARGDALLGFSLFFTLSLGLGLPYLLLATFSGSAKSLPRAGAWMEKSKKFFAVPLVLAAMYYGFLAVNSVSASTPAVAAVQNAQPGTHKAWPNATLAILEQARAQNRPVVLDFRADWCLPCLKMEEEIFSRPSTHEVARKNNVLLLQVDLTKAPQ
jgi:thiol:disulfide interchange protein DsbD